MGSLKIRVTPVFIQLSLIPTSDCHFLVLKLFSRYFLKVVYDFGRNKNFQLFVPRTEALGNLKDFQNFLKRLRKTIPKNLNLPNMQLLTTPTHRVLTRTHVSVSICCPSLLYNPQTRTHILISPDSILCLNRIHEFHKICISEWIVVSFSVFSCFNFQRRKWAKSRNSLPCRGLLFPGCMSSQWNPTWWTSLSKGLSKSLLMFYK